MANAFGKEINVAWEAICEGFEDSLVLPREVRKYNTDAQDMERSLDTIWRPQPHIAQTVSAPPGTSISSLYKDYTGLQVPVTLSQTRTAPWKLNDKELRDMLAEGRIKDAAAKKLGSDINRAILDTASSLGSLVVTRTAAATGFDDVAEIDSVMNERGIPEGRKLFLSSRDYNKMASDLAARQTLNGKPVDAYERAKVGPVCGFDTFKMQYINRLAAAAGGSITLDTRDTATANIYVPKATSTAVTGEINNVDNRFHTITVSATTNVAVGDCFKISGCTAVHHVTKGDTGQPRTFRVVEVVDGTHLKITPPIISAQTSGATDAEKQYQNCIVATKSATTAITWLNIAAANVNVFFQEDTIELLPGRFALPRGGNEVRQFTSETGIQLVMEVERDINTRTNLFRIDTFFGVANLAPDMSGILLFSQA